MSNPSTPDKTRPIGYYFGCWGRAGHFWWNAHGESYRCEDKIPPALRIIDGVYAPRSGKHHGYQKAEEMDQGHCALRYVVGWTVLAFWDRSVDQRGASNSAFIFPGELAFPAAVRLATEQFPGIIQRLPFPLLLAVSDNRREDFCSHCKGTGIAKTEPAPVDPASPEAGK